MNTNVEPPDGSRAVLIGVSTYADRAFPEIRAARNSLKRMSWLLADPSLCGWPTEALTVIADPASVTDLANQLTDLSEETSGALLVYYVGHGTLSARGELCLTVTTTRRSRPAITGVPWDVVAQALRDSPARVKIVILDCCFAGQAISEALAGHPDMAIADVTHVQGVYTLTATTRNRTAHVPPPNQQDAAPTSFTGTFIEVITSGIDGAPAALTLDMIYPRLRALLAARGLPMPNKRGTDTADHFVFASNVAHRRQQQDMAIRANELATAPAADAPSRVRTVPVRAEWALHGFAPKQQDYRLLGSSHGRLSESNFMDVIARYSPGSLTELPQVSISWISDRPSGDFVGLSIHDEQGIRDYLGRQAVKVRFFCVPFPELAAGSVSYLAMYEQFRSIELPISGHELIETDPASTEPTGDVGDLAIRTAALLLTGKPVCVLGADHVDFVGRLQFLDTVASLLPYGMRARLSAATWTSPSVRSHKFRLYFSGASRSAVDREIFWARASQYSIGHRLADFYLRWLRANPEERVRRLARETAPIGFAERDVLRMITALFDAPRLGGQPTADRPAKAVTTGATTHGLAATRSGKPAGQPVRLDFPLDGEIRTIPDQSVASAKRVQGDAAAEMKSPRSAYADARDNRASAPAAGQLVAHEYSHAAANFERQGDTTSPAQGMRRQVLAPYVALPFRSVFLAVAFLAVVVVMGITRVLPWFIPLILGAVGIALPVAGYMMLTPDQRRRMQRIRARKQLH